MTDRFGKGFFWGPPSHKRVAWLATVAGLIALALPVVVAVFGTGGHPLFLLALGFTGLAETGWGRLARWLCAVVGLLLAAISILGQLAPLWFAGVIGVGALLLLGQYQIELAAQDIAAASWAALVPIITG